MAAICSSETSLGFQPTTLRYIPEYISLQSFVGDTDLNTGRDIGFEDNQWIELTGLLLLYFCSLN
jgi:hypothetical protein